MMLYDDCLHFITNDKDFIIPLNVQQYNFIILSYILNDSKMVKQRIKLYYELFNKYKEVIISYFNPKAVNVKFILDNFYIEDLELHKRYYIESMLYY